MAAPISRSLPVSIFEKDLQAIKAEASRRKTVGLKDSAERALATKEADDIWHAMVLGADLLRGSQYAMSCVSNLGKMASMKVLPATQLTHACSILRSLLDISNDESQLRIVQTVIAFVSACEARGSWVEGPLSLIYVLYYQCHSPMVQAAVTASISQMSNTLLETLKKEEAEDPEKVKSQVTAVDYFRDVCNLIQGKKCQWLKLSENVKVRPGLSSAALPALLLDVLTTFFTSISKATTTSSAPASGSENSEGAKSFEVGASPLLTQLLNVELVQLVMATNDPTQCPGGNEIFQKIHKLAVTCLQHGCLPLMVPTVGMVLNHHEQMIGDISQPWRMALLLSVWRKPLGDARFLLQLLSSTDSGNQDKLGEQSHGATLRFLTTISTTIVGIISAQREGTVVAPQASPERTLSPNHRLSSTGGSTNSTQHQQQQASLLMGSSPLSMMGGALGYASPFGGGGSSNDVGTSSANNPSKVPSNTSILSDVTSSHSDPNAAGGGAVPSTPHINFSEYVGVAVDVMTMLAQSLARFTEPANHQQGGSGGVITSSAEGGNTPSSVATTKANSDGLLFINEGSIEFLVITQVSPGILSCCRMAIDVLIGEDLVHSILKTATHMIQCGCLCGIKSMRDDFIRVLVAQVQPPQVVLSTNNSMAGVPSSGPPVFNSNPPSASKRRSIGAGGVHDTSMSDIGSSFEPDSGRQTPNIINSGTATPPAVGHLAGRQPPGLEVTSPETINTDRQQQGGGNRVSSVGRELSPPNLGYRGQGASPNTHRIDALQQKIHVCNALISIASAMGKHLGDGWRAVVECLLKLDDVILEAECGELGLGHEAAALKLAIQHLYSKSSYLTADALKDFVFATTDTLTFDDAAHCLQGSTLLSELCNGHTEDELLPIWPRMKACWQAMVLCPSCPLEVAEQLGELAQNFISAKERQVKEKSAAVMASRRATLFKKSSNLTPNATPSQALAQQAQQMQALQQASSSAAPTGSANSDGAFIVSLLLVMYQSAEHHSFRAALLKQAHKLVEKLGSYFNTKVWCSILRMLEVATTFENEEENVSTAFRTMEFLHHSWVTFLQEDALTALLSCVGAFLHQKSAPDRININLTAGQVAWALADYMASCLGDVTHSTSSSVAAGSLAHNSSLSIPTTVSLTLDASSTGDLGTSTSGIAGEGQEGQVITVHHWNSLFAVLRDGGVDDRPEVRHSSLKTLFSLILTHGSKLPIECWNTILFDIISTIINKLSKEYQAVAGASTATRGRSNSVGGRSSDGARMLRSDSPTGLPDSPMGKMPPSSTGTSPSAFGAAASQTGSAQRPPPPSKQWIESHLSVVESTGRVIRSFYPVLCASIPTFAEDGITRYLHFFCRSVNPDDLGRNEDVGLTSLKSLQSIASHIQLTPDQLEMVWSGVEVMTSAAPTAEKVGLNGLTLAADFCKEVLVRLSTGRQLTQGAMASMTPNVQASLLSTYIQRIFPVFEGILGSHAVLNTYMFPAKPQTAVLEALQTSVLPMLTTDGQWQALRELLLSQMPLHGPISAAVFEAATVSAQASEIRKLKLGYVQKLLELWRHIITDEKLGMVSSKVAANTPNAASPRGDWFIPVVLRAVSALLHLGFIGENGFDAVDELVQTSLDVMRHAMQRRCGTVKGVEDMASAISESFASLATVAVGTSGLGDAPVDGRPQTAFPNAIFNTWLGFFNDFISTAFEMKCYAGGKTILKALVGPSAATAPQCRALAGKTSELLHSWASKNQQAADIGTSTLVLRNKQIILQFLGHQRDTATRALLIDTLNQLQQEEAPTRSGVEASSIVSRHHARSQSGTLSPSPALGAAALDNPSLRLQLMPQLVALVSVEDSEVRAKVQGLLDLNCVELGLSAPQMPAHRRVGSTL